LVIIIPLFYYAFAIFTISVPHETAKHSKKIYCSSQDVFQNQKKAKQKDSSCAFAVLL
jgi:hypothetical protein